ncbi:helix-turn-helix domain-containing protein [Frigidibacter sp. MR17.24]|uniref:helix-turn-helix domain-containing protein n=1 Tax=Frigidibacter sp. MR17.24 TaxID=3127345 RepID=UPI003013145F
MNLAKHISDHDLSRAEICAAVGISRSMLSLIEGGKRRIAADKLSVFSRVLGVNPEELRPDLAAMFRSDSVEEGRQ